MDRDLSDFRARAEPLVHFKVGDAQRCWKILAGLIQKRASQIYERRAETAEEGTELWKLAESQIEKPLCCGILKLSAGWLLSFNAAELGTTDIELCVEPRRLVLLGTNPSIGGTGSSDPVVRVLNLPGAVDPESFQVRQEGPILDIELRAAAPGEQPRAAA